MFKQLLIITISYIYLIASVCREPIIEGSDKYGWTKRDDQYLLRAKVRCGQLYPSSPCVKIFRKTSENSYQVICSKE